LLRNELNLTSPPTSSANARPTMMNQRTIRTGRARGLSSKGLPESLGSVAIFMSGTFCSDRLGRDVREFAGQMLKNCGVVKADTPKQELAQLAFEAV